VENGDEMARVWFVREAGHYAAAGQDQRPSLLDQQIKHVQQLGIMDQLAAIERWAAGRKQPQPSSSIATPVKPAAQPSGSMSLVANTERIKRWISETVPAERTKLQEFFAAIRNRMVLDTIRSWLPIGSHVN
jgi:hypothetical protein